MDFGLSVFCTRGLTVYIPIGIFHFINTHGLGIYVFDGDKEIGRNGMTKNGIMEV